MVLDGIFDESQASPVFVARVNKPASRVTSSQFHTLKKKAVKQYKKDNNLPKLPMKQNTISETLHELVRTGTLLSSLPQCLADFLVDIANSAAARETLRAQIRNDQTRKKNPTEFEDSERRANH